MSLDAECLAQLKLRQQPFDEVPSEDFLYSDPLLESLIETAAHALQASGAIVILAGAEGSGRSVQLMRLLGSVEDGLELIAFRGRANIPFDAIDVTIRNHLRSGGFDNPQRSLAELLAERARAGSALVLAIDDAHLIGSESIERLLRVRGEVLESGGQGLRLILVGDQSFGRGSLPLPDPVDDSQVVRLNLRPFNLEQAGAYLRHRLRVAGVDDPEGFLSSGDIAVLQTNSKGLPRALNRNANAWLARRCRSSGGIAQSVTRKLGGLAPSGKSTRTFEEPPDQDIRALVDAGQEEPEGILDLDSEGASPRSAPAAPPDPELARYLVGEDTKPASDDFEQILRHVRQHQLSQAPAQPAEPQASAAAAKSPLWNRPLLIPLILVLVVLAILVPVGLKLLQGDQQPSPSPPPQAQPAPEAEPILEPAPESTRAPGGASSEPEARETEVGREPVPETGQAVEPAETSPEPSAAEVSGGIDRAEQADAEPEAVEASAVPEMDEAERRMAEDLDWLMRQDDERYTIQLVAGRDFATSRAFLAQFELDGVHYIQTRSYVIGIIGSFPNRTVAANMLSDLPTAAREKGPWIRTIGSVRDSLP